MPISPEQLKELTDQPLLGVLATSNSSGNPQATPLWYHYDGECFVATCFSHRVKARNIRGNENVALVVVDTVDNGRGLIVLGRATVSAEGAEEATIVNAVRYLGEDAGRKAAAELNGQGDRAVIRIVPRKIIYGD